MSIEDPRISATASENVSHDFRQDIHEDASIETSARQGVEVAQADNNQQPEKTDRVPAAPQTAAASAHPAEIVPDQNNVAHLPADVSIDDIRVEGNNLVLIQADGTEIVIVNGALHVPTFLLGEVELPQQAVIAALEQNNINVAAGPDGSYSAHSGSPSSGGNFDTIQQPPHLPPLIADLLQNTDQPDGQPGRLFGGVGRHGQDATPPTSPAVPDGSPTVSLHVINLGNLAATLVLDESAGIQTSPDNDTALADVADLFKGVSNQGFDGHMNGAQYATAGLLQADIQFGINGPAATNAVQWSLELGSGNNHDSGLKTTGGHEIYFFEENGLIVGRYDAENGEVTSADPTAFALAIDPVTGQLSMVQYVSIYNTDSNSQDEIDFIKSGQVLAKVTVSDFDGDKVDATVDIGDKIGFSDDGPILISVPAPAGDYSGSFFFDGFTSNGNAWNENSGVNNTGVSGNWHIAWADGSEGTPQLERVGDGYLGMHSSTNGYMIDLDASPGDVAVSQVLKLAEGESYTLTFEAGAAQAGSKHLVVTFGGVVVLEIDPPGQMTTYSISIVGGAGNASNTLEFKETGDADYYGTFLANVSVTGNSAILDDEDIGKTGNQGGTGDDGHGATATGTIDFDAGSDGLGHIQITGLGSVAGLGNAALSVMYIDGTGKGTAEVLGDGVWTPNGQGGSMSWSSLHVQNAIVVTVNADGTYSVTLNAALAHPATGTEDNLVLNFGFDIYDGDGDHVSGTISVNVDDDSPSINQQALQSATVAEDDIKTSFSQGTSPNDGNADGSYTGNASNNLPGPATVSGSIANVVNFGNDGKGGFSFVSETTIKTTLGALGLSSHHIALSYSIEDGALTAKAGGHVVFTLTLSNDGDYTFKLFDQIDHAAGATRLPVDFGGLIQATDGDGDSIPLTGGLKIAITDDAPTTAGRAYVSGTVEEEQLNGNEDTSGGSGSATDDDISHHGHFHDNTTAVVSGSGANSLATLVNTGADEGGHFSFNSELVGDAIKTDGGASVKSGGSLVSVTSVAEGVDANGHYQTITAGTTGEGAHSVFTLTVYDNGSWKFELKDNLDHSYGNNGEGVLKLDLSSLVQYTDFDNDSVTLDAKSFLVSVIDDVPVAAISASDRVAPTLETQDHDTIGSGAGGTDTTAADFSGAFKITASYGADGAGTTNTTYALSLSGNSHHDDHDDWDRGGFGDRVDSGLESNDHAIYLYEINGVIVGSTASSSHSVGLSNTIFTISVDGTGKVTLTQYDAIDHVGNGNGSVISLDEGLVKLTATVTITDHDGDKATDSASIDLGCNIKFDDDTPSITLTAGSDAALTLTTQDADTIGNKSDTDSQNFAGVFPVGSSSYGADGAGNIVKSYALSVTGQPDSHNRVDSLLDSHGQTIYLYKIGNTVYGSTSTSSNSSDVLQKAVFKIEVDNAGTDAGTVKLTQYSAIDHGGDGTVVSLADNLVKLTATATITDGDGDQKSSNATIDLGGNISFEDDRPSIDVTVKSDAITVTTQDGDTIGTSYDKATTSFTGAFTFATAYGADGAATANALVKSYALDVTGNVVNGLVNSGLESHDQAIYLYKIGGAIYGSTSTSSDTSAVQQNAVFKIEVSSAGDVTLTQYDAIDHGGNGTLVSLADNLVKLTATATVTDGDNDQRSDSASIDLGGNIKFEDATPQANKTTAASLDDEAQSNGIDQGAGDLTGANLKTTSGTLNFSAGADGVKSIAITGLSVINSKGVSNGDLYVLYVDNSGVAHAEKVTFAWNGTTNSYVGTSAHFSGSGGQAAAVVVTVDQTGAYSISINAPLADPFNTSANTVVAGSKYEDNLTLNFTYQVMDGDNDTSSNTLSVTINDDSPTLGTASSAISVTGIGTPVTGILDFHAGADGAGHASLAGNNAPENLVSGGQAVHYWVSDDGATLIAYTGNGLNADGTPKDGATLVFKLEIANNEQGYTFTEYKAFGTSTTTTTTTAETLTDLDHANKKAESVNITTDNGTIVAVVSGGHVDSKGHVVSQLVNSSNQGFGLESNNIGAGDYLEFNFHQTVDSQPDPTSVTFSFFKDATVQYVVHYSDGTTASGSATVIAANGLTITAPGHATILDVEFSNIDDKTKIDLSSVTIGTTTTTTTTSSTTDLSFTANLTDGDGDAVTATINVHAVTNSAPTITVTPTGGVAGGHNSVDEAGLSTGSHHADGSAASTGTIQLNDADGNGDIKSVTIDGHTFAVTDLVGTTGQTVEGDHGTLKVYGYNSSNGTLSYSYTLTTAVTGTTANNGANIVTGGDSFTVSVTDKSGATSSTGAITIDIKDDVPTANADSSTQSVENAAVVVNVLANDVAGADGVDPSTANGKVSLVAGSVRLDGTTLVADSHVVYLGNGQFQYTPAAGEEGTVTFRYQIVDGDGDPSVATVTITLHADSTPTISIGTVSDTSVNEAGLAGGSTATTDDPTNTQDASETATGSFKIETGEDTVGHVYVTDKDNHQIDVTNAGTAGIMVHGQYGDLTVTHSGGAYSYSYTLADKTSGDTAHESFAVQVVDSDGDPQSTTLTINIVDDVPTANSDAKAVTANDTLAVNAVDGVLHNDIAGADGFASGGAVVGVEAGATAGGEASSTVGQTVPGTYGTLTLNADGSYSYVADEDAAKNLIKGATETDTFTYTIKDGDGDLAHTTLTFTVTGANHLPTVSVTPAGGGHNLVDEAGIAATGTQSAGSAAGDGSSVTTGTITLTDVDGNSDIKSVTIGDDTFDVADLVGPTGETVEGTHGTLTVYGYDAVNGTLSYSYTLTSAVTGSAANNGAETVTGGDSFTVSVTDKSGDTSSPSSTITIDIKDDVPSVVVTKTGDDAGIVATTDDVTGSNNSLTADFSNLFTAEPTYGADGNGGGAVPALSYSLSVEGLSSSVDHVASNLTAMGGGTIYLTQLPNGTIVGYTGSTVPTGTSGSGVVFSASVNSDTGVVTLTQYAAIDHGSSDLATLTDGLVHLTASTTVTDGDGDVGSGSKTIDIGANLQFQDAKPLAPNAISVTVNAGSTQSAQAVNAAFVLDVSRSISNADYIKELQAVEAAAEKLFTSSGTAITVIAFADSAKTLETYADYSTLKAAIDSLISTANAAGNTVQSARAGINTTGTDYTDALNEVRNSFNPVSGSNKQVFFISDGDPNQNTSFGLPTTNDAYNQWKSYVTSKGINVTAIGIGGDVSTNTLGQVDVDAHGGPTAVVSLTNFGALVDTLVALVPVAASTNGSILTGTSGEVLGSFGADGGHVQSITIDGKTYAYDASAANSVTPANGGPTSSHYVTIQTANGGTLTFYFVNDAGHSAGDYSYTAPATVTHNEQEVINFTLVDNDGDPASNTLTINVHDTTPPAAPVIASVVDNVPSSGTATIASGGVTNDNTPTISGTAEAGATVHIYANGSSTEIGHTTADATTGAWTFTPTALADATYTFTAKATDAAGNTGAASGVYTVTVDATAPTAAVAITSIAEDTGTSNTDFITNDSSLVVRGTNGTLATGETVQISTDGGTTWNPVTPGTGSSSGTWSYTVSNATTTTYEVRVVDLAGNIGNTASQLVTIDKVAPTVTIAVDQTSFNLADKTATVTLTFSETPKNFVLEDISASHGTISNLQSTTNPLVYTATYVADSYTGTDTIKVNANKFTDTAGNSNTAASSVSFNIDTQAPSAPTLALGTGVANGATAAEATASAGVIKVTGESGDAITVTFTNGANSVSKTLSGNGSAQAVTLTSGDLATLGDGTVTVSATQTDAAGNAQTAAATTTSFVLDMHAPTVVITDDVSATTANIADGAITYTLTFSEAVSGLTVDEITVTGGTKGTLTAVSSTVYKLDVTPAADTDTGTITVKVSSNVVTDAAGNGNTEATQATQSYDTKAPTAPGKPDLATTSDSGSSNTDNITNDNTPTFTGTGTTGSVVTLYDGTTAIGVGTVVNGNYSITASTLLDGTHSITAVTTDAAGNSTSSAALSVVIDTAAPEVSGSTSNLINGSGKFSLSVTDTGGSGVSTVHVAAGSSSFDPSLASGTATNGTWQKSTQSISNNSSLTITLTDVAGNIATKGGTAPAGTSGEAINLALSAPADHAGAVSLTVAGLPAGWSLNEGTHNADGTWSVMTNDPSSLTVTSPDGYTGALVLQVTQTWTNSDGSTGTAYIADNVEAYAKGSPIFAWSGDDTLTASSGDDTLVFANKIGTDVVHSFDTARDKIDLIGFAGFSSFADVLAHLSTDASGNAVITLGDGQTITLAGVSAASLSADDFLFNETPVTHNTGDMVLADGSLMPFSGTLDNTGSIHIASTGSETNFEIVQHGLTLTGGGTVTLSDNAANVIFGSADSVMLTNVDNTISGAGQLGEGHLTLVNKGTIIADGSNALVIDTGDHAVVNTGTLEATGTGGLDVHSDIVNDGLLWANGGNLDLEGNVSGNGTVHLSGHAGLEIGGAFSQAIILDTDAQSAITIDHAASFTGTIAGLDGNDTLHFGDISAATASFSYAENAAGTGGLLTVTDGTHTATIGLNGDYSAGDFSIGSDGGLVEIDFSGIGHLYGTDGSDTLTSGGGYTMTGGAGADTFVLDTDALKDVSMADVITDYKASEGDTLDVSKLLDSLLGHEASEAEALASVKTTVSGADTVVSVNANGGWHDVAVLQNTTEAVKILFDDKHDTTTAPHVG